jgi:arsenate reductase (thioredoxin)
MNARTAIQDQDAKDHSALPLVLILCTGNSCRSQMAEGFLKAVAGDFFEAASAGSKPAGFVHPLAIQVMAEIGIDISEHRSKSVSEFLNKQVETIITVCGHANEACPAFPGLVNRYHWPFDDPAKAEGSTAEKFQAFREVRDKMRPVFEAYALRRKQGLREFERDKEGERAAQ